MSVFPSRPRPSSGEVRKRGQLTLTAGLCVYHRQEPLQYQWRRFFMSNIRKWLPPNIKPPAIHPTPSPSTSLKCQPSSPSPLLWGVRKRGRLPENKTSPCCSTPLSAYFWYLDIPKIYLFTAFRTALHFKISSKRGGLLVY